MIKQAIVAATVMLSTVLAGGAVAAGAGVGTGQDHGWYLGGFLGQSRFDVDPEGFSGSIDRRDTAWSLAGGYQFNRHVGVELGYTDFGTSSLSGNLSTAIAPFPAGTAASANIDATAWSLAAIGTLPFTPRFSGYGKLGLNYNEVKLQTTIGGLSGSASDRNTGYVAGLGLKYDFTPSIGLRGGWERNRVGDDSVGGRGDVDLWSVGLQFRF